MIDSDVGRIIAPPTPCTTRERMSSSPFGASAAATLARLKIVMPMSIMRRRPTRSAIGPNVSSSAATTMV